jgi:restriction endonuclease S subunit
MRYFDKPNCVKISQINDKFHSLYPTEHRMPRVPCKNFKLLKELCEKEDVGSQVDVSEYLSFTTNCYLQTISCMESTIINVKVGKNISPLLYRASNKRLKIGDFCISRNASIGKISYVAEKVNAIVNGGISYFTFKEKYKFYIPAFFITNYGEDTLKCMTSGGGTQQNVKRNTLLNMKIPFPSATDSNTQEEIVEYVSKMVKSLIDKELLIKKKVEKINSIIERVMLENNCTNYYSYPNISEIKKFSKRLDTGLYGTKYKNVINQIVKYPGGYQYVRNLRYKWISGKTPNVFVENDKGKYWWIAVGDIAYGLKYKRMKRFNTAENVENNILIDGDILITRKGATVGKMNMYFNRMNISTFVNEDIKILRLEEDVIDKVFIGMFLNSYYGQTQLLNLASRGTKQGLTNDNILDVAFPLVDKEIKSEIFKEYYNESSIKKQGTLKFEEYDEKRNKELGIYQINMEIFRIEKKLDQIVRKIVNNEAIEIDYSLE